MLFSLLLSVAAQAALFGADTRSYVNSSSPYSEEGRSVAVAVLSANISPSQTKPGTYRLSTDSLDGLVCPDERFAQDPSLSYSCSGFLVAPDLIATAGHCMVNVGESKNESDMYCGVYGWLFDYQTSGDGTTELEQIPADNYYKCKRIVYAVRDEGAPFRDYALVQLERPVTGRVPFALAPPSPGDHLTMIGFPFGTPMKVSPGGRTTMNDPTRNSFLTNLAAFEGNSGSVVFNERREAVGILVGGTPSANLVAVPGKSCQRYNTCDEDGKNCAVSDADTSIFPGYQGVGSEVQRIAPIAELLRSK